MLQGAVFHDKMYVLSVEDQAMILKGEFEPLLHKISSQNAQKLQCVGEPVLAGVDPLHDDLSEYFNHLGTLVALSQLKSIKFQHYIFSRPELRAFMSHIKDSQVEDLEMSHCKISTAKGIIILNAIKDSNVCSLSLKHNHIASFVPDGEVGSEYWRQFCHLLSKSPVTQLDLQGNYFWLQALVILSLSCYNCSLVGVDFGEVSSLSWGDSFMDGLKASYKFWYQGEPINLSRLTFSTQEHCHVMPKYLGDVKYIHSLVQSNTQKLFKLGQMYADLKHQSDSYYTVPTIPLNQTRISRLYGWIVNGISSIVNKSEQKNSKKIIQLPRDLLAKIVSLAMGEYRMKNPIWLNGYRYQKRQHQLISKLRKLEKENLMIDSEQEMDIKVKPMVIPKPRVHSPQIQESELKVKPVQAVLFRG